MQSIASVERLFKSSMASINRHLGSQAEIPQLEFENGISSMWATLALARLDRAGHEGHLFGLDFHTALATFYEKIAHFPARRQWNDIQFVRANLDGLKQAAIGMIDHSITNDREKQDFAYLWGIAGQFLEKLSYQVDATSPNPLGGMPLSTQLANKFRTLTANSAYLLAIDIDVLMNQRGETGDDKTITHIRQEIGASALWIQTDLEDYISQQASLKTLQDHEPDHLTGASFVALTQAGGQDYAPRALLTCILCTRTQGQLTHGQTLHDHATAFYTEIAQFFSLASPMLSHHQCRGPVSIPPPSIFDERYPLSDFQVTHHDQQATFYANDPTTFGPDELTGSEDIDIDDISQPRPDPWCNTCAFFGDRDSYIRVLYACGHEICAICPGRQLGSRLASRYRCTFCREKFFS